MYGIKGYCRGYDIEVPHSLVEEECRVLELRNGFVIQKLVCPLVEQSQLCLRLIGFRCDAWPQGEELISERILGEVYWSGGQSEACTALEFYRPVHVGI